MILKNRYCVFVLAALLAGLAFLPSSSNKACAATANPPLPVNNNAGGAGGGSIAPQTCDTQVWQTMEMRAKMETEREVMQNQNLIFKPDSILAYTCFDSFAAHAAAYVGPLFTHTEYWGKLIIEWGNADPGLDYALQTAVTQSMQSYFEGAFDHTMLGGRGQHIPGSGLGEHTVTQVPSHGADYTCQIMSQVWKAAKCMNFIHATPFEETDGFYPFKDLSAVNGQDVKGYQTIKNTRKFPEGAAWDCGAGDVVFDQGATTPWELAWEKSRNETEFGDMNLLYQFSDPLEQTFIKVQERIEPGECTQEAIMTGVTVVPAPGEDTWEDGVCTNPGCTFTKDGTCTAAGS